jgi:hypothetical protein
MYRQIYKIRSVARELTDTASAWLGTFAQIHWPCVRRHARGIALRLGDSATVIGGGVAASARALRAARQLRLSAMELAGIVLVTFGVSFWSVPAAVILGGLVLVAIVEVRPHVAPAIPQLPVPEPLLRAQAEQAARLLNNVRFGVGEVDITALDKLSRDECERIITLARSIGVKT